MRWLRIAAFQRGAHASLPGPALGRRVGTGRGRASSPHSSQRARSTASDTLHSADELRAPAHGSTPAVYKIKPLFRAKGRTSRRAASDRIKVRRTAARLCAGAAGPAPAARSNAPQIKGTAARSASVIIIMQALRGARDSSERATRAARAPRDRPLPALALRATTCQRHPETIKHGILNPATTLTVTNLDP